MIKTFQERYAESKDKTLSCVISEEIAELRARVIQLEALSDDESALLVMYSQENKALKDAGKLALDTLEYYKGNTENYSVSDSVSFDNTAIIALKKAGIK